MVLSRSAVATDGEIASSASDGTEHKRAGVDARARLSAGHGEFYAVECLTTAPTSGVVRAWPATSSLAHMSGLR